MRRLTFRETFLGTIGLLTIIISSCNNSKQNQLNYQEKDSFNLHASFDVSAKTKLFIKDIENEIKSNKSNIDNYVPSQGLVNMYNLKKQNKVYIVHGFIKTTRSFKHSDFNSKNIKINGMTRKVKTISFSLNHLQEVLSSPNIVYFELSEKAFIK